MTRVLCVTSLRTRLQTPVDGILTDMDASYEDGFFTCKYSRPVTVADFSDVPDLSVPDAYYILVAMGTTTSASKLTHMRATIVTSHERHDASNHRLIDRLFNSW